MVHSHVGKYACGSSKSKYIFKSRTSGDWRDDPTVKNTNCYSKEPEFNSYHQYGCSHLSVILVSEVLIPSNRHIFKQNIYAHKNKLLKHKNRLWRYESMIRTIVSLFLIQEGWTIWVVSWLHSVLILKPASGDRYNTENNYKVQNFSRARDYANIYSLIFYFLHY